jgi:hypothetical protein
MPKSKRNITDSNSDSENIGVLVYKIDTMKVTVDAIDQKLEANYATKEWCNSQYGTTVKMFNGFLITFGSAIVIAVVAFIVRGGLK